MKRSCPLCGRRITPSLRSKDHLVPKSLGGDGSPANTWIICRPCNNRKGDRLPNESELAAFAIYRRKQTNYVADRLMYLFGSFKPSERATLLESARGNAKAFTEALEFFLARWAAATWIEEYNVERVGEWISAKCPPAVRNSARVLAESQLAQANGDEASIHFRTYRVFLDGLARLRGAKHPNRAAIRQE